MFVGSGSPGMAQAFRSESDIPAEVTIAVDPERKAYAALGLKRGVFGALSVRSVAGAARAWRAGYRQGKVQGDPWQNGGTFVVAPDGDVVFAHVSQRAGDHPSVEDLLGALSALNPTESP